MSARELITDHLDLWTSAVTTRSTAGRGRHGKIELTGIKKLRELILELAVRGKLVDQDPGDEPASVLLDRIAEEKARLVKEGRIKKPKNLPEITEGEKPFELPEGWIWTRLSDVLRVINGRAYKKQEMLQEGTPLLRVGNLFTSNEWYYSDLNLEDDKYIDHGDLIYAWSASFGPFIWDGGKVIYHYHIWKLELYDHLSTSKHFLYNYLKAVTEEIKSSGSGIAMIHMTKAKMEELVLPFPPPKEQQRIVDKIDELMALCDRLEQQVGDQLEAHEVLVDTLLGSLFKPAEGSLTRSNDAAEVAESWARIAEHFDTLFTKEASIDKLKQTILQLAVMGRLVAQDAEDESGTALLQKILPEVERLIKKGRFKLPKEADSRQELRTPHPIPLTWTWCTLDQISVVARGGSPRPIKSYLTNDPKGFSWIKIGDAMKGSRLITQAAEKIIPEGLHKTRMVYPGDLILSNSMSFGQPYILDIEGCIHDGWLLLRTPEHLIDKVFLYYLLLSPYAMKAFSDSAAGAVVQNLNADKVRLFQVPLPPKEEQHRIVEKVDELLALCERLKARLGEAGETRTHLAEAVVEEAVS